MKSIPIGNTIGGTSSSVLENAGGRRRQQRIESLRTLGPEGNKYTTEQIKQGASLDSIDIVLEQCQKFLKNPPRSSRTGQLIFSISEPIDITELPKWLLKEASHFELVDSRNLESLNALEGTTTLDNIHIHKSKLTAIPSTLIKNNPKLTRIMVTNSLLSFLPEEICDLAYLNDLNIEGNRLTALPKNIGRLNDVVIAKEYKGCPPTLCIGNGQLKSLPESITQLTNWLIKTEDSEGRSCFEDPDNIDDRTRDILNKIKQNNERWLKPIIRSKL